MIKVIIKKNSITVDGHAMYDDYGKDIVCAGASSILITTVNAILKFDNEALKVIEGKSVTINILKNDNITKTLIENMIEEFKELAKQYPKNIKIEEDNNE